VPTPLVQIIIGSTRPGRVGDQVAKWVYEQAVASNREMRLSDFFYETVR